MVSLNRFYYIWKEWCFKRNTNTAACKPSCRPLQQLTNAAFIKNLASISDPAAISFGVELSLNVFFMQPMTILLVEYDHHLLIFVQESQVRHIKTIFSYVFMLRFEISKMEQYVVRSEMEIDYITPNLKTYPLNIIFFVHYTTSNRIVVFILFDKNDLPLSNRLL